MAKNLNEYEALRERLLSQHHEMEKCRQFQEAINENLTNEGSDLSFEDWLTGCEDAANENADTLKAVLLK
jgi:hypothetical protein